MFGSIPVNPGNPPQQYNPAGSQQRGMTPSGKSVYQTAPRMQMYQGAQQFKSQYPMPNTKVQVRAPYPVQPMPLQSSFTMVPPNTAYRSGNLTVTNMTVPQYPAPQINWAPQPGYARPLPMPPFQMPPTHPATYTIVPPGQTYTSGGISVTNMHRSTRPPAVGWQMPMQYGMQPPYQQQRSVYPYQTPLQFQPSPQLQRYQNELMQGHARTTVMPPSYDESEASPSHKVPQPTQPSVPPVTTEPKTTETVEPQTVPTSQESEELSYLQAAERLGIDDLSDLDAQSLRKAFAKKTAVIFSTRKKALEECAYAGIQPDRTPVTDKALRQSGLSSREIESKSPQEKQEAALAFFKTQLDGLQEARLLLRELTQPCTSHPQRGSSKQSSGI